MVTLTINGQVLQVEKGTTILEAAAQADIHIPHLCYLKGLNEIAACRVCCVEVEGERAMVTACNTPVREGMVVHTNSPRARATRRTNVEDVYKRQEWLREKGLAAQTKKAGKIAAEGVSYAITADNGVGVVIEVNSQTDFVAKNEVFQGFVKDLATIVANENPADVEALKACTYPGTDRTVADVTADKVLAIGENIQVRRFVRYAEGVNVPYIHMGGKIGEMCIRDRVQTVHAAAHGLEVGEHAAQPAGVHIVHAHAGGLLLDGLLGLLLGAHEEDGLALLAQLTDEVIGLLQLLHGLLQVDDIDPVALGVDVGRHLGIPTTGLVAEVHAGLQQLLHRYDCHDLFPPKIQFDLSGRVIFPANRSGSAPAPGGKSALPGIMPW